MLNNLHVKKPPEHIGSYLLFFFVFLLWITGMTLSHQLTQILLLSIGTGICIAYLRKLKQGFNALPDVLLWGTGAFMVLFIVWNLLFNWYSQHSGLEQHIFRGVFNNLRAPFYGRIGLGPDAMSQAIVSGLASLVFIVYLFSQRKRMAQKQPLLYVFAIVMPVAFAWQTDLSNTFAASNCHYQTFAGDLDSFASVKDLFSSFVEKMPVLGPHNNHYPPGFLLLFLIEKLYLPYFVKASIFITVLLGLFPLKRLMRLMGFGRIEQNTGFILYISSGSILHFSGIALSPLLIPLTLWSLYFLLHGMQKKTIQNALLFALSIGVFSLFSFLSLTFVAFCALFVLLLLVRKAIHFRKVILFGGSSALMLSLLFFVLYLTSGFHYIDALITGRENIKASVSDTSQNTLITYLITSSGNLLAYAGSLGMPLLGMLFYQLKPGNRKNNSLLNTLLIALVASIFLLSFSNRFILETERVWLFFTPLFVLAAAPTLKEYFEEEKSNKAFAILTLGIVLNLLLYLFISFCG